MEVAEAVWTQPEVFIGQEVLFYPHGERSEANPTRAVVTRVWPGFGCRLALVGGGIATTHTQRVRHMDDPYFLTVPNAKRSDGAWDHTDFTKLMKAKIMQLEFQSQSLDMAVSTLTEQVSSLEAIVAGLTEGKSKK